MKVRNCGVGMASSDTTFIQTGSITPRQSACKQVVRCPYWNYPSTQCIWVMVGYKSVWMLWRILTLPCMELRFLNFLAHSLVMSAPLRRKKLQLGFSKRFPWLRGWSGLNASYCPGPRCFKFWVPLNPFVSTAFCRQNMYIYFDNILHFNIHL